MTYPKKNSQKGGVYKNMAACMTEECPDDPDLLLLRDAAADERDAIALYLKAATKTCFKELFLDVTEDEMQHYVEIMRLISMLDPVQAEMLQAEGLDYLVMQQRLPKMKAKWTVPAEKTEMAVTPPDPDDLQTIELLTKALTGELQAVNKYQRYMNMAQHMIVKELFCELMNEEKEHIAEFTKALFEVTSEPICEMTEDDDD